MQPAQSTGVTGAVPSGHSKAAKSAAASVSAVYTIFVTSISMAGCTHGSQSAAPPSHGGLSQTRTSLSAISPYVTHIAWEYHSRTCASARPAVDCLPYGTIQLDCKDEPTIRLTGLPIVSGRLQLVATVSLHAGLNVQPACVQSSAVASAASTPGQLLRRPPVHVGRPTPSVGSTASQTCCKSVAFWVEFVPDIGYFRIPVEPEKL